MLSGHVREEPASAAGRKRERHPEIDPDTRLGLHPTLPPGALKEPAVDSDTPSSSSSGRVL